MAVFVGWRLSTWLFNERPLAKRLPGLAALVDLLLLPSAVLVAGALVQLGAGALKLTEAQEPLRSIALLCAHLTAGWALARAIEVLLLNRAAEDVSERIPKIVVGLIYVAMMLIGLATFLWQRGYAFTGIWVSTGVAAGVLGFALQRTLGDLFSGIALGMERPFRLGDWVELKDGTLGQVIDLNWRATRLRGWDNATYIIPNASMAGQAIKNLHDDKHLYAPWYFVKLPAEVEPRFASALLLEAALRCESVLKFPYPVARLADATTIPYSYMVWVHLRNYQTMFRAREELFREIHISLQNAGIETAPEVHELRTRRARITTAEPPSIRLALKSLDLGGLLTEEELDEVVASSRYCHFDSGHRILGEGDASAAFYIIAGGLVEASVTLRSGEHKVTETLGPGDSFGITAMLTEDSSLLEFAAKSDVNLIRTDIECVRTLLSARPELAEHLAQIVKRRLDAAEAVLAASRRNVRRLSLRDIRQRIEGLVSRPGRGGPKRPPL
nr:mechanosensitive ion channel family protein [Thiorhodococcus mannitoliphagus]